MFCFFLTPVKSPAVIFRTVFFFQNGWAATVFLFGCFRDMLRYRVAVSSGSGANFLR